MVPNSAPSSSSSAERPSPGVLGDIFGGLADVIQAEIRLAKLELVQSASEASWAIFRTAAGACIAILSFIPFLAFLIIGLGEIMHGNYWLSSLLISFLSAGFGFYLTSRAWKKVQGVDLSLPATRRSFEQSLDRIGRQLAHATSDLSQTAQREARTLGGEAAETLTIPKHAPQAENPS